MTAGDVITQAVALLNDTAQSLYTNSVVIPYVIKANEDLEKKLIIYGAPQQRKKSSTISLSALATTLSLPTDFLLPIRLFERDSGATNADWVLMKERDWEQESAVQTNTLNQWAFRDNNIYFIGATVAKDVLLEYERRLAVIVDSSSTEDFTLTKGYLAARTAELCARYIGMNSAVADEIAGRDVGQAEDELMRVLVLNQQGNPQRRRRFGTGRVTRV
jgi:hypothetical protein